MATPNTHIKLLNGKEALLTEDILVAAATLVASGQYTAESAVDMALKLNDILVERLQGSY
jgi:hypothetical protein